MTATEQSLVEHLIFGLEKDNQKFQSDLKKLYPRLTNYDLRLCIYLKANLSTKEIALISNITPDSVKKAKHRLRRKLRLRSDATFLEFF